jgi:hypothetical protein
LATTAKLDSALTLAGKRITQTRTLEDEGAEVYDIALVAGIAGTLTTRTSNTEGVITVATGHGITASDTIGVAWGTESNRTAVDVTATTGTTITIALGAGTNLPVADTEVIVSKRVVSASVIDMNAVTAWGVSCTSRSVVVVYDDQPAIHATWDMPAKDGLIWVPGEDTANPLDAIIVSGFHIYNADLKAGVFNMAFLKSTM